VANTAQSDLDNLQTIVTNDATLTKAQKAHCQTHLYALARMLFGNAFNPPSNGALG
jgi:hypothetical protein